MLFMFHCFYRPNNCVHSLKRKREGYEHPSELHVSTSPSQQISSHHPLDGDKDLHEPFRKSVRKQGMGGRFRHWWRAVFSKRIFSIVFFVMVAEISFKLGMVFLLTLNETILEFCEFFFNRLFGKKADIGIRFCYWRKLYGDVTFTASQNYLGRFFLSLRWTIILRRSFKSDTS